MVLTLLLACWSAPAAEISSTGVQALEAALRVAPSDALRLALAEEWAGLGGRCEQAVEAYRHFFEACPACLLRDAAIGDLAPKVGRCFSSLAAQNRFRAELELPAGEPELPTAPTCQEIFRLARALDDKAEAFMAMPDVFGGVGRCVDSRARLWARLLSQPITSAEVRRLLSFVMPVDLEWAGWILGETRKAEARDDKTTLEALREDVLVHFADPEAFERCEIAMPPLRRGGYVTLNTLPESEVYLDGVSMGTTPVARMRLEAGTKDLYVKEVASDRAFKLRVDVDENAVKIYQAALGNLEPLDAPLGSVVPAARSPDEAERRLDPRCLRVEAKRFWIGNKLPEAAAAFNRCVSADAGAWDCWRGLAVVEANQGRIAEACRALRQYLDLRPQAPDAAWVAQELARCRE